MASRKRGEQVVIIAVIVLAFFFLSPMIYWFTAYSPTAPTSAHAHRPLFTVYRSPSCVVFGVGLSAMITAHSPGSSQIRYTCRPPPLPV